MKNFTQALTILLEPGSHGSQHSASLGRGTTLPGEKGSRDKSGRVILLLGFPFPPGNPGRVISLLKCIHPQHILLSEVLT